LSRPATRERALESFGPTQMRFAPASAKGPAQWAGRRSRVRRVAFVAPASQGAERWMFGTLERSSGPRRWGVRVLQHHRNGRGVPLRV